jgi:hypothetical protein
MKTKLKIGDTFKFTMVRPKGYLVLTVLKIEDERIPWCKVIEHFYAEKADDEDDEYDRYKTGDVFPYVYTDNVEII